MHAVSKAKNLHVILFFFLNIPKAYEGHLWVLGPKSSSNPTILHYPPIQVAAIVSNHAF